SSRGADLVGVWLDSVTIVVRDYDEAIEYFTKVLGFRLREDSPRGDGKRWVVVAPDGPAGASILLAPAATPAHSRRIGNQTGGPGAVLPAHRHVCRDLCGDAVPRRAIPGGTARGTLRYGRCVRRSVRQPLGPAGTAPGPIVRRWFALTAARGRSYADLHHPRR